MHRAVSKSLTSGHDLRRSRTLTPARGTGSSSDGRAPSMEREVTDSSTVSPTIQQNPLSQGVLLHKKELWISKTKCLKPSGTSRTRTSSLSCGMGRQHLIPRTVATDGWTFH